MTWNYDGPTTFSTTGLPQIAAAYATESRWNRRLYFAGVAPTPMINIHSALADAVLDQPWSVDTRLSPAIAIEWLLPYRLLYALALIAEV